MMIFFIVILIVGLGICIFVISNLYEQITQLERYLQEATDNEEQLEKYYQYFLQLFARCKVELDKVDKRGAFSSDDEVGFAFKVIQQSIGDVAEKLKNLKVSE